MALERRNPLPPGVYHIDVMAKNLPAFIAWRTSHKDRVKVRKTHEDSGIAWLLFEVTGGVDWDSKAFGFPSIAEQGLSTERPAAFEPTKDILDQVADKLPAPSTTVAVILWGGAALAAFLIYRELKQ